MERVVGTVIRGIRTPIVNEGDPLEDLVIKSILRAAEVEGFGIKDRDIIGITESVVARAQGNYATVEAITADLKSKFDPDKPLGVVFPILSRNRFSILLKSIARSTNHIVLMLSYPSDEVGNHLVDIEALDEHAINPWTDDLTEREFRECFGDITHPFTGIDYVEHYRQIIEKNACKCTILFSNNPGGMSAYTDQALGCDVHTRCRTKRRLIQGGVQRVYGLDEIMTCPVGGSGYNPDFGLLGSNMATEDKVKLFPREGQLLVESIQQKMSKETGRQVEVLIYGDGAFKDPVGKIWELADPVVSPAYTSGLEGTPSELKIKYLADNRFADLKGDALRNAIAQQIREKGQDGTDSMESQGTTPRRLTDLIGSLCDLTSGSGDKGTPVIHIQGYFDHFAC